MCIRDRTVPNPYPLIPSPWPLLLIPLALMYAAGATDPAFLKFLLAAVPFVCVLMGRAWACLLYTSRCV